MTTNLTDVRRRITGILRAATRPGTEAVIGYLESSSYFRRGCHSHHRERGGLARHSLEVYDHMISHSFGFPADSIAVAALFHDLGKTARRDGRGHGRRSVDILDRLGFTLTDDERTAIARHHDRSVPYAACPLRRALTLGDRDSAGRWNRALRERDGRRG